MKGMKDEIEFEILQELPAERPAIKAVVFDFDGTLSTLRYGWETIMEPFMLEMIAGDGPVTQEMIDMVREYIDQSTGIQTIFQMQWLAEKTGQYENRPDAMKDPWWYKGEYNRRLMDIVNERIKALGERRKNAEDYLMAGSKEFLAALKEKGVSIYAASGTDHPDVVREAAYLGLFGYFNEIAGAPAGKADCSKDAVLRKLIKEKGLLGSEVAVVGDGRVEIALGREIGAITLGIASNEEKRSGINEIKKKRLVKAGAYAITGDFRNINDIFTLFNL